jgi:nitrogen regulatory protein P-II 1
MKKIEAYIQPFMLRKVVDALMAIHIHGMSVIEAKGFGKEKDESYPHDIKDYVTDFTSKTKIEIICADHECEKVATTIQNAAHTGRKGDGKLFITDIQKAVSIRTGEENEHAI